MVGQQLKNIAIQLKRYSLSLEKTSLFIDQPWTLIDGDQEQQKLIFKKNKDLILSKNGQVQIGKWEYLPEAKSILIDRVSDQILCNASYVDKSAMILKLDGTNNKFFALANENLLPDLDIQEYFKNLRYSKLEIIQRTVLDGKILEVQRYNAPNSNTLIGSNVFFDGEKVPDGKYPIKDKGNIYEINESKIIKVLNEHHYSNPEGVDIIIQQQNLGSVTYGDYVSFPNIEISGERISFSKAKDLIVRDGMVIRLERKNKIFRWLSKEYHTALDDYRK